MFKNISKKVLLFIAHLLGILGLWSMTIHVKQQWWQLVGPHKGKELGSPCKAVIVILEHWVFGVVTFGGSPRLEVLRVSVFFLGDSGHTHAMLVWYMELRLCTRFICCRS